MLIKTLKILGILLLLIFVGILIYAGIIYHRLTDGAYGEIKDEGRPSVLQYYDEPLKPQERIPFFEPYIVSLEEFANPALRHGPHTRWWWPGNDVNQDELARELRLFKAIGIAGVEIQPFTMGLNLDTTNTRLDNIYSWDTPSFYEHVQFVLEVAKEEGLTVDMNTGGGWPTGGFHVNLEDNFKHLIHSEQEVKGGKVIQIALATPKPPITAYLTPVVKLVDTRSALAMNQFYPDKAQIETVIAARAKSNERSRWVVNSRDQIELDPASVTVLDAFVDKEARELRWEAPKGKWQIITFWSMPADAPPVLIPTDQPAYVVDHFDSTKVIANYNYLFGNRTGLSPYFGNPLRALFNDSYEFAVERHYATDFFDSFEEKRGYDIRPWLPVAMVPAYNHAYAHLLKINGLPAFRFSEEDWRIQHDYDLTISELLWEQFFDPSQRWMHKRNLVHRTQGYGLPMDIIGAAGRADIPETEQLFGEGAGAIMKLVSSGAHLYQKPLVSAESIVFMKRAQMTTPLKMKLAIDKALVNGVNHLIYHGTAYTYMTEDFGKEGWYPWSSPHYPAANFSSDIREVNNFWESFPALNQYVTRAQYLLQAGKPQADLLVYYPFLGMGQDPGISDPSEVLPAGYLAEAESTLLPDTAVLPLVGTRTESSEKVNWLQETYPLFHQMDYEGVSWEWVNDESLLAATVHEGKIHIRGLVFQALVFPHLPYLPLPIAQKLTQLADGGGKVIFVGNLPEKQPGYKAFARRDSQVQEILTQFANDPEHHLHSKTDFVQWIKGLPVALRFTRPVEHIKHISRKLDDGTRITFFTNTQNTWNKFTVSTSQQFPFNYWLNPISGDSYAVTDSLTFTLPPYSSIFLYQGYTGKEEIDVLPVSWQAETLPLKSLHTWRIEVGAFQRSDTSLFDWRKHPDIRFYTGVGSYSTSFTIDSMDSQTAYLLDLGTLYFTATVHLNGQKVGAVYHPPYKLNLSPFLKPGTNELQITVQPANLNHYIGEGIKGNPHYVSFKDRARELMPSGLLGPVQIEVFREE